MENKTISGMLGLLICGILVAGASLLSGCGSRHMAAGRQVIDTASQNNKPEWIQRSVFENDGRIHFVGQRMGRARLAPGLREARADAERKVITEIASMMSYEWNDATLGENVPEGLGETMNEVFHRASEKVSVSGLRQSEQYYEKIEENRRRGVGYVWNCYVALSMSQEDYLDTRDAALTGAIRRARSERNKDAERLLEKTQMRWRRTGAKAIGEAVKQVGKKVAVAAVGAL